MPPVHTRRVKLLVGYSLFLFVLATSGTLLVQSSGTANGERIIGLLDLPQSTEVVYSTPASNSAVRATVRVDRREGQVFDAFVDVKSSNAVESSKLPTLEVGYEEPAFIVHERIGGWFRVQLPGQTGWIERAEGSARFDAYPELLTDRLTYLVESWDRRLLAEPGAIASIKPVPQEWRTASPRQLPIQFLGWSRVNNEVWLHVRIDAEASCVLAGQKLPSVEGWVPAYQTSGQTTAWFYSRGC